METIMGAILTRNKFLLRGIGSDLYSQCEIASTNPCHLFKDYPTIEGLIPKFCRWVQNTWKIAISKHDLKLGERIIESISYIQVSRFYWQE